MGVYIKGMDMPTRCGRCDMRIPVYDDGIFDNYECCITAAIIDNLGEKMEDCPLVPVPPHGRLGDLDALKVKAIERSEKCGVCVNVLDKVITAYDIETAPTIIPEDKED